MDVPADVEQIFKPPKRPEGYRSPDVDPLNLTQAQLYMIEVQETVRTATKQFQDKIDNIKSFLDGNVIAEDNLTAIFAIFVDTVKQVTQINVDMLNAGVALSTEAQDRFLVAQSIDERKKGNQRVFNLTSNRELAFASGRVAPVDVSSNYTQQQNTLATNEPALADFDNPVTPSPAKKAAPAASSPVVPAPPPREEEKPVVKLSKHGKIEIEDEDPEDEYHAGVRIEAMEIDY
jgi:hypothetical protein